MLVPPYLDALDPPGESRLGQGGSWVDHPRGSHHKDHVPAALQARHGPLALVKLVRRQRLGEEHDIGPGIAAALRAPERGGGGRGSSTTP